MRGSEHNDPFILEDGVIRAASNHAGGILGGISSGMPVVFRVAFKPTPSIAKKQRTVRLSAGTEEELQITGRHDPCILHRALSVIEAAAALAVLGYSQGEIAAALKGIDVDALALEEIIKQALKRMVKN